MENLINEDALNLENPNEENYIQFLLNTSD